MKKRKSIFTILLIFIIFVAVVLSVVFLIKGILNNKNKDIEENDVLEEIYESFKYVTQIDKELYAGIKDVHEGYIIVAYDKENKKVLETYESKEDFKTKKLNSSLDYYLINIAEYSDDFSSSVGFFGGFNNEVKLNISGNYFYTITSVEDFLNNYLEDSVSLYSISSDSFSGVSEIMNEVIIDNYRDESSGLSEALSRDNILMEGELLDMLSQEISLKISGKLEIINGIDRIGVSIAEITIE